MVNNNFIAPGLLNSWAEQTHQLLLAALASKGTTLGHLEELLKKQASTLLLPILSSCANHLAASQPFCCPHCHNPLLFQDARRTRDVRGIFGIMTFKRAYGWCHKCKCYCFPADHALGLQPQAPASPKVQELAALLSIRNPFQLGAMDAYRLTGLELGPAFLHREAQRQGSRAHQLRQKDVELSKTPEGVAELTFRSKTQFLSPFTLIIQIDAWNIRERDDWGETMRLLKKGLPIERWHWVFTGTVFRLDQRGETAGKRRVITDRGYVVTRESLDSFTHQIYAESLQRGLAHAQTVLIVADGAIWIWNLADSRFKGAKQRVDLYHVKEHLYELAWTLHGHNTPQAHEWLKPLLQYLDRRKEGALDVLNHLEGLKTTLQNLSPQQVKALETEIGYFTTHKKRMDYKEGKALGEPVGSGAVESTATQYQRRFKTTGQFWTQQGDEALLALSTLHRNQRWHLLYPHSIPQPNLETLESHGESNMNSFTKMNAN